MNTNTEDPTDPPRAERLEEHIAKQTAVTDPTLENVAPPVPTIARAMGASDTREWHLYIDSSAYGSDAVTTDVWLLPVGTPPDDYLQPLLKGNPQGRASEFKDMVRNDRHQKWLDAPAEDPHTTIREMLESAIDLGVRAFDKGARPRRTPRFHMAFQQEGAGQRVVLIQRHEVDQIDRKEFTFCTETPQRVATLLRGVDEIADVSPEERAAIKQSIAEQARDLKPLRTSTGPRVIYPPDHTPTSIERQPQLGAWRLVDEATLAEREEEEDLSLELQTDPGFAIRKTREYPSLERRAQPSDGPLEDESGIDLIPIIDLPVIPDDATRRLFVPTLLVLVALLTLVVLKGYYVPGGEGMAEEEYRQHRAEIERKLEELEKAGAFDPLE